MWQLRQAQVFSIMDPFMVIAIGFLLFFGLALFLIFWQARRSSKMIDDWADEHGFEVVEKKQPLINLGPFRWENPHGRTFYQITARDDQGQEHGGWVCCGAEWLGLFSNKVEVRWDTGEPPQAAPFSSQVDEGVWPPPPTH